MSSSGTSDMGSSAPFSDGGGGGTTGSATNKPTNVEAVDSTPFGVGDLVLAFHGHCLYDAKVQRVELRGEELKYYIHYVGWKKSWDEWVSVDCLLKHTEENVQRQEQLNKEHATERSAKPGRLSQDKAKSSVGLNGKKREHDISGKEECVVPCEKLVSIRIPSALKKQLVNDQECVTHLGQLVKLPCSPNACEILNKYFEYRAKKDGVIGEAIVETMSGLRSYFDKALPAMLLYKEEREQYKQVIADNVVPSCIYGAEHFLRLFVKLPEMLSSVSVHMEMETYTNLQQILKDFLKFLKNHRSTFFSTKYQCSDGSVAGVKEEEN